MYFEDLTSFIRMGGHGPYVWSAYALGLIVMAWNILAPLMARKRILTQLQRQIGQQRRQNPERVRDTQTSQQQDLPAMKTEEEGTQ